MIYSLICASLAIGCTMAAAFLKMTNVDDLNILVVEATNCGNTGWTYG